MKRVDDQRSYLVSPVGLLEEPVCATIGRDGFRQTVLMSYGVLETIEHSENGAIGALMGYLDDASPDIALSEAAGWEEMQQLTESEHARHLELCAKEERECQSQAQECGSATPSKYDPSLLPF